MMTRARRQVYRRGWFKREEKIGYRLVRKNGNQYNRRIRRCKSDDYKNKRYMYIETIS